MNFSRNGFSNRRINPVIIVIILLIICLSQGCTTQTSTPVLTTTRESTTAQVTTPAPLAIIDIAGDDHVVVELELAITTEEHMKGLMNRSQLDWDSGMLFVFNYDAPHAFWMKNTLLYLDVLYISNDGNLVHIRHNAEPLNETSYFPPVLCRYVLEVNGGFCQSEGVTVGDTVEFVGL